MFSFLFSFLVTKSFAIEQGSIISTKVDAEPAFFKVLTDSTVAFGSNNTFTIQNSQNNGDFIVPEQISYQKDNFTVVELSSYSFYRACFKRIVLPKTIQIIGEKAFFMANIKIVDLSATSVLEIPFYCFALSSATDIMIPNTVENINDYSFYKSLITEVNFPKCLKKIGSHAFCLSFIEECNLSNTNIQHIDEYAFARSRLSVFVAPKNFTSVGICCFAETPLKSIFLPNSTISIDESNFENCTELVNVDMSSTKIVFIPQNCFFNCFSLKECFLPECIEGIDKFAFFNTSISKVSLTNSLKTLGEYSFMKSKITKINLKKTSVELIGKMCFAQCKKLTSVTLPLRIDSLNDMMFMNTSIKTINIPKSVKEFGFGVFYCCTKLETIDLSTAKLTRIPSQCFYRCIKLSNITLGSKISFIGNATFFKTNFLQISIAGDIDTINEFTFAQNKELKMIDLTSTKVKYIFNGAFSGCKSLKKVKMPQFVQTICNSAFSGTAITKVIAKSDLVELGNNVFLNSKLEICDLSLTTIETINANIFAHCRNLKTVLLPKNLQNIAENAFFNSTLESIEFPNSLLAIKEKAFSFCDKITEINFGNTELKEIASFAFAFCSNLTSFVLSNTLKTVSNAPFEKSPIKELIFPSSTKYIAADALKGLHHLEHLDLQNVKFKRINNGIFDDLYELVEINLPPELCYVEKNSFIWCSKLQKVTYYGINFLTSSLSFASIPSAYVSENYRFNLLFGIPVIKIREE